MYRIKAYTWITLLAVTVASACALEGPSWIVRTWQADEGVMGGQPYFGRLSEAKGVKFLRMERNAAVYAVGSGSYQFQSILADAVK